MMPLANSIQRFLAALLLLASIAPLAQAQYGVGGYPACQGCVDGICIPNRQTHGYYPTRWRRWPDGSTPTPATQQDHDGPEHFVVPDVREETDFRPGPYVPDRQMPSQSERMEMEAVPPTGAIAPPLPTVPSINDGAWNAQPFVPLTAPLYPLPTPMPGFVPAPTLPAASPYLPVTPAVAPSAYLAPAVPQATIVPANYAAPAGYDAASMGQIAPAGYQEPEVVLPSLGTPPGVPPAPAAESAPVDPASLLPPLPQGSPAPYAPARGNPLRGG